MARKKIELNRTTEKLVNRYIEDTDIDFNDLANKALKYYIVNKLTPNEVKAALKDANEDDSSRFLDEILQNNIDNHWNL